MIVDSNSNSIPIDLKAAALTFKGCKAPQPKQSPNRQRSETPLPLGKTLPTDPQLAGMQIGRLTVIGKSIKPKRYVVRCACGWYEIRTHKALHNPFNADDCCHQCQLVRFSKKWREYITKNNPLI